MREFLKRLQSTVPVILCASGVLAAVPTASVAQSAQPYASARPASVLPSPAYSKLRAVPAPAPQLPVRVVPQMRVAPATPTAGGSTGQPAAGVTANKMPYKVMSLKQLINMKVTSVSKKKEKAANAPAALYVLTQEDIRRSGATSIPELLRQVPGINVARAASGEWAITARGFNDQFANKLLVLMDGRSVYTPIFSGVYWNSQHQMLDNIERIEVIRGPGATLWGANAVNGVINIITKAAEDTQGTRVEGYYGNRESGGSARHGGEIGDSGHYRAYASYRDYDDALTPSGGGANDDWRDGRAGMRADINVDANNKLSVQTDYYSMRESAQRVLPALLVGSTTQPADADVQGGNLNVNWQRRLGTGSDLTLKGYYDFTQRDREFIGKHTVHTVDMEFQHSWMPNRYNDIVWGGGYRLTKDDLEGSQYINFSASSRENHLFSAFVQDKIPLVMNSVYLTLGSKFEYNDYSGAEYQPNARLSWLVNDQHTLWASMSRATRSPSRGSSDVRLLSGVTPGLTAFTRLEGDSSGVSEDLIAYEVGYRAQPMSNLTYDIALFYNDYNDLYMAEQGTPYVDTSYSLTPYGVVPFTFRNIGSGESYGGEIDVNYQVSGWWKLAGAYSFLRVQLHGDGQNISSEGSAPQHQLSLRSYMNLPFGVEFDTFLYYNDNLSSEGVDRYFRLDTRLGMQLTPNVALSVVGQNLLDPSHQEFSPFTYTGAAEIGRTVYGKVDWTF